MKREEYIKKFNEKVWSDAKSDVGALVNAIAGLAYEISETGDLR